MKKAMRLKWYKPDGTMVLGLPKTHLVREDGRIEEVCEHGVGHPVGHLRRWQDWMYIHGCDGCTHANQNTSG